MTNVLVSVYKSYHNNGCHGNDETLQSGNKMTNSRGIKTAQTQLVKTLLIRSSMIPRTTILIVRSSWHLFQGPRGAREHEV